MCREESAAGLVFRCTQKLRKRLGVRYEQDPCADGSILGPWYANQLSDDFNDVAICVNERTRLAVLVDLPRTVSLEEFAVRFRHHLGNLLLDLGLDGSVIQRIMDEYRGGARVTPTQDRSLLGTMNDFASIVCYFLEEQLDQGLAMDLGAMLHHLNDAPLKPLGGANPIAQLHLLCAAMRNPSSSS